MRLYGVKKSLERHVDESFRILISCRHMANDGLVKKIYGVTVKGIRKRDRP